MGLSVSHGCWDGAYSAFYRWRTEIAKHAGIPLRLMEGFCDPAEWYPLLVLKTHNPSAVQELIDYHLSDLPIRWASLKPDPLHLLLNHSDCDGEIDWRSCNDIAQRLEEILSLLPTAPDKRHIGDWRKKTQEFIDGLRLAADKQEHIKFT